MGCSNCSTGKDGKPGGCRSNGGCSSGGCNRLNTYDWLSKMDVYDNDDFDIVEVSFSQGARKGFYHNPTQTRTITGDTVLVETDAGYDIGKISLSGELVRMQMRKKRVDKKHVLKKVIRTANNRDLERMDEAKSLEKATMIRARAIARTLDLNMKLGDVEYQADKRKATFYYTADGRVDFRELIRHYAKEFKVKIEMRQIGARQESARIGGIGSCGRELCCSTWLSDFKTVSTAAARYQNLAINQAKLSGQCGRLKCCLNYELDTYIDALDAFPKKADYLHTEAGKATLVKTDIFGGLMYYCYVQESGFRGKFYPLSLERVKDILVMNKRGEKPVELIDNSMIEEAGIEIDFESVNDVVELPMEERRRRKKRRNKKSNRSSGSKNKSEAKGKQENPDNKQANSSKKDAVQKGSSPNRKPRNSQHNKSQKTPNTTTVEKTNQSGNKNTPDNKKSSSNTNNRRKSSRRSGNRRPNTTNQQNPKPENNQTAKNKPNNNNKSSESKKSTNSNNPKNRNRNNRRNNRNNNNRKDNSNPPTTDKKA